MAKTDGFSTTVAARTRAAQAILASPDLLKFYTDQGGLTDDLDAIVANGRAAEAGNLGQSTAGAEGQAATKSILDAFDRLRDEYQSVMGVVQAVRGDLSRAGASAEVLTAVDRILVNEVPVRMVATGTEADAAKKKTARRVQSQEAIRAEVEKDAGALIETTDAHAALTRRRVDGVRLEALRRDAAALAGLLGERAVAKGAAKGATVAEREAVRAQKAVWGATYRILASVGRKDPRVQQLLSEAAAKE